MLELPTDNPRSCEGSDGARRFRRRPDARSRTRSTRNAASSSRNGAAGSAPARGSATSSSLSSIYQSRYADRLPIGKPEIIRNAPGRAAPRVLRHLVPARSDGDHCRRRRRPAAARSGDSATTFGPLKARGAAASPPDTSVPLHKELLVNVTSDPEVTQSSVQLIRKRPKEGEQLVGDYRRTLVEHCSTRCSTIGSASWRSGPTRSSSARAPAAAIAEQRRRARSR